MNTQLAEQLEELADVLALNPQEYLSMRRVLGMATTLQKKGFCDEAAELRQVAHGSVDQMVETLRKVSYRI